MNKKLKKTLAGVISATMLVTATSSIGIASVSAETTNINYGDALALSLYFYDANQCGSEVDDNCLTWRGNCHTYDAEASLDNATGLTATEKAFIQEANGGSNTVDVSGGYHDAGDHLKFSMTMGFSATNLAWAYYQYPEAFEKTGSKDHLFDILKEMCDYFMKVTYLDDNDDVVAFCYMVGGDQDHNEWSAPETQTMDRPTYWATASHPSADASGQMSSALASASIVLREVDSDYADKCLKYANALQEFTAKYPSANYDGVGSYYSSGSQNDDVAWSDLWCHIANDDLDNYTPITPQNGVYNGEYDCWVYSWDKVWGGYATLLSQLGFGDAFTNEVKYEMDNLNTNYSQAYYPIGGGWGASRYNCAWQMYAMEYASATNNDQYYEYAKSQMDYLLGNNPQNRSYLLGFTENSPVHIHHRGANPNKSETTYTLYGALVGGPTDASGSYDDSTDSFSCTEPALDYNGCFIMAIAGLYDKYGNGTENLDTIITNASEIDETFEFGTWYANNPNPQPQPTETTTTDDIDGPGGLITLNGTITAIDESNNTVTIEVEENGEKFSTVVDVTMGRFFSDGNYSVGDDVSVTGFAQSISIDPDWWFDNASFTVKSSEKTTTTPESETTTTSESETTTTSESETTTTSESETTTSESETTTSENGGGSTSTKGDVNGDNKVNVADLIMIRQSILHIIDDSQIDKISADVNDDGKVNVADLIKIRSYILHTITSLD